MPTCLRVGPYRFFFFAGDGSEPPHIHVERDNGVAKFWLDPVQMEKSVGFSRREIASIHQLVIENEIELLRSWNEFFIG